MNSTSSFGAAIFHPRIPALPDEVSLSEGHRWAAPATMCKSLSNSGTPMASLSSVASPNAVGNLRCPNFILSFSSERASPLSVSLSRSLYLLTGRRVITFCSPSVTVTLGRGQSPEGVSLRNDPLRSHFSLSSPTGAPSLRTEVIPWHCIEPTNCHKSRQVSTLLHLGYLLDIGPSLVIYRLRCRNWHHSSRTA